MTKLDILGGILMQKYSKIILTKLHQLDWENR